MFQFLLRLCVTLKLISKEQFTLTSIRQLLCLWFFCWHFLLVIVLKVAFMWFSLFKFFFLLSIFTIPWKTCHSSICTIHISWIYQTSQLPATEVSFMVFSQYHDTYCISQVVNSQIIVYKECGLLMKVLICFLILSVFISKRFHFQNTHILPYHKAQSSH